MFSVVRREEILTRILQVDEQGIYSQQKRVIEINPQRKRARRQWNEKEEQEVSTKQ